MRNLKAISLVFAVFLFSCGAPETPTERIPREKKGLVPPVSLEEGVERFEEIFQTDVSDEMGIFFVDDSGMGNNMGICFGEELVYLREALEHKPNQFELVLFHELGHCHFGLTHEKGVIIRNGEEIPFSLMTTKMFDGDTYRKNRSYYIRQMKAMIEE